MNRRVVVTGIGVVSPLGCGSHKIFQRLCAGESGIYLKKFESLAKDFCVATVPRGQGVDKFDEQKLFGKNAKDISTFMQYALHAADLAVEDAGGLEGIDLLRAGVCIGSGIGSIKDIISSYDALNISYKKVSPRFIPKILINMAAGAVSLKYGLKGPLHSVSTACAAGSHSIGDAYNFIRLNYADSILAGGSESSINDLSIAGFHRLKALSTDTNVKEASRPFDAGRSGFVMGEGATVLVLEELQSALRRNANILAELTGYGLSADSHHVTSPCPEGDGAKRAMQSALHDAQLRPEDIQYINAHATSTPVGDDIEIKAIESVFRNAGKELFVSSTKGATGHLLGAAGALEAAFTVYAIKDGIIPPTLHLTDFSDVCFSHVPGNSVEVPNLRNALSNSFGFGGTNSSLIFSKYTQTPPR